MPKLGYTFDAANTPEREFVSGAPREPLAEGRYRLMATVSTIEKTRNAKQLPDGSWDAERLTYECDVQAPPESVGRKLWISFNIKNPNQQTMDIAHRELGEMSRACGKASVTDSDELLNIMFDADIIVTPGKDWKDQNGVERKGNPQNVVKAYMSAQSAAPSAPARPTTAFSAPTQTAQAAAKSPPWKK